MNVVTCGEIQLSALQDVLSPYGIDVLPVPDAQPIPGTHFGDPEAGLIAHRLYIRSATPVHSALHDACHYLCMASARRARVAHPARRARLAASNHRAPRAIAAHYSSRR